MPTWVGCMQFEENGGEVVGAVGGEWREKWWMGAVGGEWREKWCVGAVGGGRTTQPVYSTLAH